LATTVISPFGPEGLSFQHRVSLGAVDNFKHVNKFGRNPSIASGPEDIWDGGGVYTGQPGTAETVDVFSADAADDAAGTGLQTLYIQGIDATGAEAGEVIAMAGTALATSTGTYQRIYRAYGLTGGAAETNVGAITARHTTTTANIFTVIAAGAGQSQVAAYTIPSGYVGLLYHIQAELTRGTGTAASGLLYLMTRASGSGIWRAREVRGITNAAPARSDLSMSLAAGTDIKVRAQSTSADVEIAAAFDLLLVPA
jgi:hypothetical protein